MECEWPLIVCFLIIDGVFRNDTEQIQEYEKLLMSKLITFESTYGDMLIPKYFYTPAEYIEAERLEPNSKPKVPSLEGSDPSCLYLMGQAVLIITRLLLDRLLHITELDPIRRYMPSSNRPIKTGRYSSFQV